MKATIFQIFIKRNAEGKKMRKEKQNGKQYNRLEIEFQ